MNKTTKDELPYHAHAKVPLNIRQRLLEKVLKKRLALFSAALATLEASRALEAAGADAEQVFQSARYATGDYTVGAAYDEAVSATYVDDQNEGAPWAVALARELNPASSMSVEEVSALVRQVAGLPGPLPVDDATVLQVARRLRALDPADEQAFLTAFRSWAVPTHDANGAELPF